MTDSDETTNTGATQGETTSLPHSLTHTHSHKIHALLDRTIVLYNENIEQQTQKQQKTVVDNDKSRKWSMPWDLSQLKIAI